MKNTTFYTLLLSLLPGVGPSRYWSFVERFGSAEAALMAPVTELPNLGAAAKTALQEFQQRGELSNLSRRGCQVLTTVEKHHAQIISHQHQDYPSLLQQIHQPPPLLYLKGNSALLSLPQIAMVGTRNPTQSGIENSKAFSRYLAKGGFTVTSGLALGVDGFAHEGALAVKGNTIAVMATGIDRVYPARHQALAEAIVDQGGLLLTEFIPGTEPRAANFPRRNRIISGLSLGVLVVEAAVQSGSLITARYAMEQNREVFAIPGSIHNPQAKGCHTLIKDGAQLIECGDDIIKQLSGIIRHFIKEADESSPQTDSTLEADEQKVMHSLGHDPVAIEQIIERTGFSSAKVSSTLMNLEIKGLVKHSHWGYEALTESV